MLVKFYADHHNARFVWGWEDGEYTTDDSVEIENLVGIGLRHEEVMSFEEAKELVAPIEQPKKRRGRKKKDS
jgi:hypothetical protein